VVHSFIESRQYKRGALFIDYDEWGGFFDHVKPRLVPDERETDSIKTTYGLTGFRTPGVCVSPFTRGGRVSHMRITHESILKLISYRFKLGSLNKRHRHATNIGRSMDFEHPRRHRPDLPDPAAFAAQPCAPAAKRTARPKPHDMAKLESSGYLERLGYEVPKPTFDQIFRNPDAIRQALRDSER
jgi:phospholipase C